MSGNLLTVAVGVAGVLASVFCSVAAFRWGAEQADRQKAEVLNETKRQNAELLAELATLLRSLESDVTTTERHTAWLPSRVRRGAGPVSSERQRSATTELLVRASLGALLDERGEVRLERLFGEVATALGAPSQARTIVALQRLRESGLVDWDGAPDLSDVSVVRVPPPGGHRRHWSTTKVSGAISA
jgi:hypothetical protein